VDISEKINQELLKKENLERELRELRNSFVIAEEQISEKKMSKSYLHKLIKQNRLNLLSMTLMERQSKNYYYNYLLEGNEKDLINFLKKIKEEKFSIIKKSPIKMEKNTLEMGFELFDEAESFSNEEEEEKLVEMRKRIFLRKEIDLEFLSFNKEAGIVILRDAGKSIKRFFINKEESIEYLGEVYRLKVENGRLIIE
jgi:hypothetical protein